MAKQKKKKKKTKLSKKDRNLFSLIFLSIYIAFSILTLLNSKCAFYIVKLISDANIIYCERIFNAIYIIFYLLITIGIISSVMYYECVTSLKITFKEYFSGKNIKAKKQFRKYIIFLCTLCILLGIFGSLSYKSRVTVTNNGITEYHILEDTKFYAYDDIKQATVEYRRESVPTGKAGLNRTTYNVVIAVDVGDKEFEFNQIYFYNSYSSMMEFLDHIDENKIKRIKPEVNDNMFL